MTQLQQAADMQFSIILVKCGCTCANEKCFTKSQCWKGGLPWTDLFSSTDGENEVCDNVPESDEEDNNEPDEDGDDDEDDEEESDN